MNTNLFASWFLLTSQWAQVSWERFYKLPELQEISMAQPRGILMSRRSVLFAEAGASFLLLDMQPWESLQWLVFCILGAAVQAGKQTASNGLLLCVAACQVLLDGTA